MALLLLLFASETKDSIFLPTTTTSTKTFQLTCFNVNKFILIQWCCCCCYCCCCCCTFFLFNCNQVSLVVLIMLISSELFYLTPDITQREFWQNLYRYIFLFLKSFLAILASIDVSKVISGISKNSLKANRTNRIRLHFQICGTLRSAFFKPNR